jgi:hypothetical protein
MPSGQHPNASTRVLWLLPAAALLAIIPLILHGCSCGQDLAFHVQSWLDAAQQLRHGHYPRWDFTAAWNAGEPRFLFYPPLSWLLGATLTLIFPIAATPTIFIFITLIASGLTFYEFASSVLETSISPNAALIASALYLANPYMLFNAFERSALAELLAAAWIPLLLLAVLRDRPTIRGIAIPLALLWLTNAPAAVIGSYTLALLATLRVLQALYTRNQQGRSLALTYIAGTILGLALPAFYLIPAAYERRFIQVAMAIIPNLRYQDNFLFTRNTDAAHNLVNHTASTLALTLLILTAAAVLALLLQTRIRVQTSGQSANSVPTEVGALSRTPSTLLIPSLALLTALIAFLLTPISALIWHHLPELAFLQFPWRLLTLLTPMLAFAIALFLFHLKLSTKQTILITLLLPLVPGLYTFHLYAQSCDSTNDPSTIALSFATHHGFAPTDEYTPTTADNDVLRSDNPGYWLAPGTNPNTPAPNTFPTATELNPSIDTDDTPIPLDQTLSTPAPHHLTLKLPQPETLILNLRAYPSWRITRTTQLQPFAQDRNDGLLAIALPSGPSTIDITWHNTPDQQLGVALSTLALIALVLTYIKPGALNSRRPRRTPRETA